MNHLNICPPPPPYVNLTTYVVSDFPQKKIYVFFSRYEDTCQHHTEDTCQHRIYQIHSNISCVVYLI